MEEIIKCEECGELFNNKKIKANHVRWKHRDQTFYKNKASAILKESYANRHGVIITENVTCSNSKCDKTFSIEYRTGKKKIKNFCSRSCANSRGTLSIETKQKIADSLKKELKECICKNCNKQFKYYRKKIYCSSDCYALYKKKDRTDLRNYRLEASFNFNIFDYPEEFDLELIKKYGFYSAANRGCNLNGISRDHAYSCKMGLINNIDPKILSHPANCILMRHNDNISKHSNSSITIDELLIRIEKWNKKYK
jgi:uncharacterized C2H2 Zn-finger protein